MWGDSSSTSPFSSVPPTASASTLFLSYGLFSSRLVEQVAVFTGPWDFCKAVSVTSFTVSSATAQKYTAELLRVKAEMVSLSTLTEF